MPTNQFDQSNVDVFRVASDRSLRDKKISPTRVTTAPISIGNFARTVFNVIAKFGWTSLYLIHDENSYVAYGVILGSFQEFANTIPRMQMTTVKMNSKKEVNYEAYLSDFSRVSRGDLGEKLIKSFS